MLQILWLFNFVQPQTGLKFKYTQGVSYASLKGNAIKRIIFSCIITCLGAMNIVLQIVTYSLVSIEKNVAVEIAITIKGQVMETQGSPGNQSVRVHVQVTQALNAVVLVDQCLIGWASMKLKQPQLPLQLLRLPPPQALQQRLQLQLQQKCHAVPKLVQTGHVQMEGDVTKICHNNFYLKWSEHVTKGLFFRNYTVSQTPLSHADGYAFCSGISHKCYNG